MTRVITFGTFDLYHIGHVNILERAKQLGDYLIVGVSSDKLNWSKKQRHPIYTFAERKRILETSIFVDKVFQEDSLEKKRDYILENKADILVMGDDWAGRFDEFQDICSVVYLPRTDGISSTEVIEKVADQFGS
jgi:glycerol-3-phosphate cytidylyltransferase